MLLCTERNELCGLGVEMGFKQGPQTTCGEQVHVTALQRVLDMATLPSSLRTGTCMIRQLHHCLQRLPHQTVMQEMTQL